MSRQWTFAHYHVSQMNPKVTNKIITVASETYIHDRRSRSVAS
jgi:hypothetical protein